MKQKIVIKLSMASEKSRSKAMVLAAKTDGVSKMGITGDGKDRLEVEGEGVDAVCLVKCLRKKLCCHADILQVEEVKPAEKKPEEKKPEEPKPLPYPYWPYPHHCYYPPYYSWC